MTAYGLFAVLLSGLAVGALLSLLTVRALKAGGYGKGKYPRFRAAVAPLLNAVLYAGCYAVFPFTPQFWIYAAFCSALIVISAVDLETRSIYLTMNLLIFLLGLAACFACPLPGILDRPAGLFASSLPLLLIFAFSRKGMGLGDVELAAAGGFLLGWRLALLSLILSCVAFSIIGLLRARMKGTGVKISLPFGPFLAFGFVIAALFGNQLISVYLRAFF